MSGKRGSKAGTNGEMEMRLLMVRPVAVATLLAALTLGAPLEAGAQGSKRSGEVVFLRGLANVFSLGLDTLSKELNKYGVNSYVKNHKAWEKIGKDIIKRHRKGRLSYPVVIIGHSLGAGASPRLALMLASEGIAVDYMVTLDAVETLPVRNYIKEAVNYYLPRKDRKNELRPHGDFEGEFTNVNVKTAYAGIDHFNIDENEILRGIMTNKIFELIRAKEDLK
jgi:hypothetical protein